MVTINSPHVKSLGGSKFNFVVMNQHLGPSGSFELYYMAIKWMVLLELEARKKRHYSYIQGDK